MSARGRRTEPDGLIYPEGFRVNAVNREWNHHMYHEYMPVDAEDVLAEPTGTKFLNHEIVFSCPCKDSESEQSPKRWMLLGTLQGHRRSKSHKDWIEKQGETQPKHYMEWKYMQARFPAEKYQPVLPAYIHLWDSVSLPIKPWTPVKKGFTSVRSDQDGKEEEEVVEGIEEQAAEREVDDLPFPPNWTIMSFRVSKPRRHPPLQGEHDDSSSSSTDTSLTHSDSVSAMAEDGLEEIPTALQEQTTSLPPATPRASSGSTVNQTIHNFTYSNMKTVFNSSRPKQS